MNADQFRVILAEDFSRENMTGGRIPTRLNSMRVHEPGEESGVYAALDVLQIDALLLYGDGTTRTYRAARPAGSYTERTTP